MSEHAAVKDEHRKLMDMIDCTYFRAEKIQLLADFARDERLKEAEWWSDPKRQNGPATLYSNEQERIEQLKRGEA